MSLAVTWSRYIKQLSSIKMDEESYSSLFNGCDIWIENPYGEDDVGQFSEYILNCTVPMYVPARIVSIRKNVIHARTVWKPQVLIEDIPLSGIFLRNMNSKDNVAHLVHTSMPELVHQIYVRYQRELIYTNAGRALLAINPYRVITNKKGHSIYGAEAIKNHYANKTASRHMAPHIFDVAWDAVERQRSNQRNQSILISGESGSGKSETTKILIQVIY